MALLFRASNEGTSLPSSEDNGNLEAPKTPPILTADVSSFEDLSRDLRNDTEMRAAFLATFTAEEEKAIMGKVDRRFLLLIGIMFMVKNVNSDPLPLFRPLKRSNIIGRSTSPTRALSRPCRKASRPTFWRNSI